MPLGVPSQGTVQPRGVPAAMGGKLNLGFWKHVDLSTPRAVPLWFELGCGCLFEGIAAQPNILLLNLTLQQSERCLQLYLCAASNCCVVSACLWAWGGFMARA